MVGNPEVILGLDLFGGQVVTPFHITSDYRQQTHHPGPCLIDKKFTSSV
jgi:hypothetical protein